MALPTNYDTPGAVNHSVPTAQSGIDSDTANEGELERQPSGKQTAGDGEDASNGPRSMIRDDDEPDGTHDYDANPSNGLEEGPGQDDLARERPPTTADDMATRTPQASIRGSTETMRMILLTISAIGVTYVSSPSSTKLLLAVRWTRSRRAWLT